MVGKSWILGAVWAALALGCAFAPGASAAVVHSRTGQFIGVAPRPGAAIYLQSEWSNGSGGCAMQSAGATITPRFSVPAGPRTAGSALSFDPTSSTGTYP